MSKYIEAYRKYYDIKDLDASQVGTPAMPIPKFSSTEIMQLCKVTRTDLSNDTSLLNLTGDFVIVGDLHGNIRDLLRIFSLAGSPGQTKYLFVGDYVDRGNFSIEVVTLLFALKHEYPQTIFLLRGNHEFEEMNGIYGFREECLKEYGLDVYDACNKCFALLPFAAILNKQIFVVHGGLSPTLLDTCQLMCIPKPVITYKSTAYEQLVTNIVWSDPTTTVSNFGPSTRKMGCVFGIQALKNFLSYNKLQVMIRGHQCVTNGVEKFENDHLYTVFSSSNYSKNTPNKSGIIKVVNKHIKCFNFPPIPILKRQEAVFEQLSPEVRPRKNSFTAGSPILAMRQTPQKLGNSRTESSPNFNSSPLVRDCKTPRPVPVPLSISPLKTSPPSADYSARSPTPMRLSPRGAGEEAFTPKKYPIPKGNK